LAHGSVARGRSADDGAGVRRAVDLPEALQIASARRLDLVLLDLALPSCEGIQAVVRFHGAYPDVPILVLSASDDDARIRECIEAGACGYIPKTLAVAALSDAMKLVASGGVYLPPPRPAVH
jgi:DNA-binding NarL/FixJ family response regulator